MTTTSGHIEFDLSFSLLQDHHDQVHWADGEPLAANVSMGEVKKPKSKDFMVVDKSSTTMSQGGWEEGSKGVVKVKVEDDGDAPDRNQRICEKVPDGSESKQSNIRSSNSNEGLMSTKLEGKRLAEVTAWLND